MDTDYLGSKVRDLYWRIFRRFLDRPVTTKLGDLSATFIVTEHSEYQRASSLGGERVVIEDILNHLRPDDVFFDIGANIGTHCCFVGGKLYDGKVVAFEPHPLNVKRLSENLELNGIDGIVEDRALSDRNGTTTLNVSRSRIAEGGHKLATSVETGIEIETMTADTFVYQENHPEPDIIKLDVEGAEKQVLNGMVRVLSESECRIVYFESHGGDDEVQTILRSKGFSVKHLQTRGDEKHYRAERK